MEENDWYVSYVCNSLIIHLKIVSYFIKLLFEKQEKYAKEAQKPMIYLIFYSALPFFKYKIILLNSELNAKVFLSSVIFVI